MRVNVFDSNAINFYKYITHYYCFMFTYYVCGQTLLGTKIVITLIDRNFLRSNHQT